MKLRSAKSTCAVFLLCAAITAPAQSTWNYFISDAGGGNSLVTWNVSGALASAPGTTWASGPFQVVNITVPGLYLDSYSSDGSPQSIPTLDGSLISNGGEQIPINWYYTYNVAGGGADGFGLGVSPFLFVPHGPQQLFDIPGTGTILIPADYSNFNPGTYQSAEAGFVSGLTVNLTVGPVPEPSTLTLLALGSLATCRFIRRRA